jgi:PAS domain S-box-containing protein
MTTPLRVLFVEDDEDDAHLSLRELKRGGFDVTSRRVDTKTAMEHAVAEETWDLVICDHVMPQFSSAMALDVMRKHGKDIPFIIVSGAAPEDVVTAAMRAGAQDFISKNSLIRLVPAVQRELREATVRRERQQIAARLMESEDRYTNLFIENPAPMLLVHASTLLVVDANPAAATFFGHSLDKLKQASIHALSALSRVAWKAMLHADEHQNLPFSDQMLRADGSVRDVDVCAVKLQQGGRSLLLATLFDQTERKLAERSLSESEARFRNLADSTPMLIWTSGLDGKCNYFNRTWLEFRGRTLDEERGEGWAEGVHPEDLDRCLKTYMDAFGHRVPFEMEYRILRHDGIYRWLLEKGLPRFTQELEFTGYVGSCMDITDRKAAEEAMALHVAAVEQVAEAIAITDTEGTITYTNKAFQLLTGFTAAAVKGWSVVDLLEQAQIRKALLQAAQGGTWEGKVAILPVGGKNLDVDATCSPVRDGRGVISHLVMVMRDVTKELELERELRQAEKMDALGCLAAGIVHDSNNILTTILTAAELIKWNLPTNSPLLSRVDVILQAGLCAAGLNKQILSFSRKSEEKRLPLDLSAIARNALQMLRSTLPANIELRSELVSGVWVEGDPVLLHQIILNLAINAFHAMRPDGGLLQVSLTETLVDDRSVKLGLSEGRYALLTVKDTGCGMDQPTLERIFDPFFTTKPPGEGTGLGLSVVHASVTKAGGKILVSSTPGKGAEFRIHWPCVTGLELPTDERLPQDVGGSETILFVDDEELVSALAKLGLQNLGYTVTTRTNSLLALEEFRAHPDDYDLVFTDLAMPELNGVDLACKIQEIRPATPVLLVSGLPLAAALSLNSQAKFQGFVAKPFTTFDLAEATRKTLDQIAIAGPKAEPAPAPAKDAHPRRESLILLAEDSHVTRSMVKTWLERAGCQVVEARDGLEAWEHFTKGPHRGQFALVLTDVVMPKMDGLELTQLLRKSDPSLPIAILTSNEDKDTVKAALNLGVNEFLNKPFEAAELVQCVEHLLAVGHSRLNAKRSVETAQAVRLAQKSLVAVPEKDLPLFSLYEPLTDAGGDVFRCMKCADGSILFILADVAGHSVLSSYAVASFLAMLSTYVGECATLMAMTTAPGSWDSDTMNLLHCCNLYGKIPCDPLRHLALKFNQGIQSGPFSEIPICVLLGLWTPATGRLKLLNAGIPHGLLGHQDDANVIPLEINGTPLGIFPEPMVEESTLQLEPGNRLLFGTDGFFDVLSSSKRSFQDAAQEHWGSLRESPIDLALSVICEEARSHGGGMIADDLLVIGFEQPPLVQAPGELVLRLPSTARAVDMACDRLSDCIKPSPFGQSLDKGALFNILLAAREALTNAVIHGNRNRPENFVTLRCWQEPEQRRLRVAVTDEGPGFDLDAHEPPQDPLSVRGRGIPLIRTYAQDVQMLGSQLTMTFQLEEMTHDDR